MQIAAPFAARDCESCGFFIESDGVEHCPQCGMRYPLRRLPAYRNLHLGSLPSLGALAGAVIGGGVGAAAVALQVLRFDLLGLPFPVLAGGIGGAIAGFLFARKTKSAAATGFGAALGVTAAIVVGANWLIAVPLGVVAGAAAGWAWFRRTLSVNHAAKRGGLRDRETLLQKRLADIRIKRNHFSALKRKVEASDPDLNQSANETIEEAISALAKVEASTQAALTHTELDLARNHLLRALEYLDGLSADNTTDFERLLQSTTAKYKLVRHKLLERSAIPPAQLRQIEQVLEQDVHHLEQVRAIVLRKEIARETENISAITTDELDARMLEPILFDEGSMPQAEPIDLFSDELTNELARLRAEHRVEGWEDEDDLWEEAFE